MPVFPPRGERRPFRSPTPASVPPAAGMSPARILRASLVTASAAVQRNSMVIHLTLVPFLSATGELKTKPTQHSVKTLMESGIKADVIVCRTEIELSEDLRNKISLFCNVRREAVIQSIDVETIYDVPLKMLDEGLDKVVIKKLKLKPSVGPNLSQWKSFLNKYKNPKNFNTFSII